jgi:cobalamin-dependent methionine synthase I
MSILQKIVVPFDKVLARLQFAQGKTQLDGQTRQLIDEELELAARLIVARQAIASSVVTISGTTVMLAPNYSINSKSIAQLLQGAGTVYGFAVTIGAHLENKRRLHVENKETTRALILDAIGSVAVELLADMTNTQICDDARKQGHTCTQRFSPGFGDWAVSGQAEFLTWLDAKRIGVSLTPQSQMLPEKSISAIVGIKQ